MAEDDRGALRALGTPVGRGKDHGSRLLVTISLGVKMLQIEPGVGVTLVDDVSS